MGMGGVMADCRINPLHLARAAPRCGAKTRQGGSCQSPAMPNGRCRMHGGKSPGAPKGNRNAWKHGRHSGELIAERQALRALLADMRSAVHVVVDT